MILDKHSVAYWQNDDYSSNITNVQRSATVWNLKLKMRKDDYEEEEEGEEEYDDDDDDDA